MDGKEEAGFRMMEGWMEGAREGGREGKGATL